MSLPDSRYGFVYVALPRGITGEVVFGTASWGPAGWRQPPSTPMAVLTGAATRSVAARIAPTLPAPRASWAWWLVPAALFTLLGLAAEPAALVVPVLQAPNPPRVWSTPVQLTLTVTVAFAYPVAVTVTARLPLPVDRAILIFTEPFRPVL